MKEEQFRLTAGGQETWGGADAPGPTLNPRVVLLPSASVLALCSSHLADPLCPLHLLFFYCAHRCVLSVRHCATMG